jgi:LysM repeat protein
MIGGNKMKILRFLVLGIFMLSTFLIPQTGSIQPVSAQSPCGPVYTVQPNDTLSGIANRCDVSIAALLEANPIIEDRNFIYVGQQLDIPITARQPSVTLSPEVGTAGTRVHLLISNFPANTLLNIYTAPWDMVGAFYSQVRTGPNGAVNTTLEIPDDARPNELWVVHALVADEEESDIRATSNAFNVVQASYIVREGDTLSAIAARFNITVDAMIEANPDLEDPRRITPGQELNLPERAPEQQASVLVPVTGAQPGRTVQIGVRGLPAETPVEIGIGPSPDDYEVVETVQTDANGRISMRVPVPGNIDIENQFIFVAAPDEDVIVARPLAPHTTEPYLVRSGDVLSALAARFGTSVSEILRVNPQIRDPNRIFTGMALLMPEKGAGEQQPVVVISQIQGAARTDTQVTASGFPAGERVNVYFHQTGQEGILMENAVTDQNGRLRLALPLPDNARSGQTWAVTVQNVEDPDISATSNIFRVTENAPLPVTWERVNIHLISIGDGDLGCNDRLVVVSREIEETRAPTMNALRELFNVTEEEVDQMGLYNSLGGSDLTIESSSIDNGHMMLYLAGDFVIGGVCDTPRVEAQIVETATQYRNVDTVDIFINGEPLDEVLSVK